MKNLLAFTLLFTLIYNNKLAIDGVFYALSIWTNNVYPTLLPSFVLIDYILSTTLLNKITTFFSKYLKVNPYKLLILLISIIVGTPTNAKVLSSLKSKGLITNEEASKLISHTIIFNPFLVSSICGIRIYLIILFSNLITLLFLKIKSYEKTDYQVSFSLQSSIKNNMIVLIYILGTMSVFLSLGYALNIDNIVLSSFITGIFEFSSGLFRISRLVNTTLKEILYIIILSFGSFSIFFQIKSILNYINLKYFLRVRLIVAFISIIICILT